MKRENRSRRGEARRKSGRDRIARRRGDAGTGRGARLLLPALLVVVLTIIPFLPTLRNEFVDWDDFQTWTQNEPIRSLSGESLRWMMTTSYMGAWQPLGWFTAAVEYRLFAGGGGSSYSRGVHATSILLHGAASLLCFLLIRRILVRRFAPGGHAGRGLTAAAFVATLLFSVHPLRVEPIGWATGQSYVLALLFSLASVLAYLEACEANRAKWLLLSWFLLALSLLSKLTAAPLFAALLVLDWHPLGRFSGGGRRAAWKEAVVEKIPSLLLGLAAVLVAALEKKSAGSTMSWESHGLVQRAAQACYGLVFYAHKTLLPIRLSPIYELRLPLDVTAARYVLPALLIAVSGGALIAFRRRLRGVASAALAYGILIFPVLGFLQSGNQEVADRYAYLPCVTWSVVIGGALTALWEKREASRLTKLAVAAVAGAAVVACASLTVIQCGVWRNTASLWSRAVALQRESSIAQNGYGFVLLEKGETDAAIARFEKAIRLKATNEMAHRNLWTAYRRAGRSDDLIRAIERTTRLLPDLAEAHHHLGNEYARAGRLDDAARSFRRALALDPRLAVSHRSLAGVLRAKGDTAGAIRHSRRALALDPSLGEARRILAMALHDSGRNDEAIRVLREALRADRSDEEARLLLDRWTTVDSRETP